MVSFMCELNWAKGCPDSWWSISSWYICEVFPEAVNPWSDRVKVALTVKVAIIQAAEDLKMMVVVVVIMMKRRKSELALHISWDIHFLLLLDIRHWAFFIILCVYESLCIKMSVISTWAKCRGTKNNFWGLRVGSVVKSTIALTEDLGPVPDMHMV